MNNAIANIEPGEIEALKRENERSKKEVVVLKKEIVKLQGSIKVFSDFLNKGGHAARQRRKKGASDEIDTCLALIDAVIQTKVWPKRKFLPNRWKEWNPTNTKCTSSVLTAAVEKNIPHPYTPDVFWHVHCTQYCAGWYVTKRNAETSRMKGLHAGEPCLYS